MSQLIRVDYTQFFDRNAVIKAIDREERKILSKAGSFVWKSARSSISKRKKPSQPGSPPSSHTGRYRKSIVFGYDKQAGSVVIGPSARFGGSEVPELLEFGGSRRVSNQLIVSRRGRGRRSAVSIYRYSGTMRYRARPHMGPALKANISKFPKLFANTIK